MSQPPKILIVEDEDNIRLSFRDYLKANGFNVLVASDGVGAIKQMLDNEIDLIVSDYRMELFGGDYWIRFLERFCPTMKIIITSGYLTPDYKSAFPVITKPFEFSDLVEKINQTIST